MTFWIVLAAVVVVGTVLAWWSSGRHVPRTQLDPRPRALSPEESFQQELRRARFDQTGGAAG